MSRIVAGTHRGRRFATPKGDATRPTSERVREAVFSHLATWSGADAADVALTDCTFVDLWAGSGAMAFEAMSRGARLALAVEKDRPTAQLISRNATELGLPVQVRAASVESVLQGPAPFPVDVLWGDPPYPVPSADLQRLLPLMAAWMAPKGLVVLERARRSEPLDLSPWFDQTWERGYGETTLYLGMTGE